MQSFLTHLQRNKHKNEKGKKKEKTSLHNTKSHTPSFSFESVSASKTLFSKGPTTPYLLPFYTRVPSMFFNTPQHKKNKLPTHVLLKSCRVPILAKLWTTCGDTIFFFPTFFQPRYMEERKRDGRCLGFLTAGGGFVRYSWKLFSGCTIPFGI